MKPLKDGGPAFPYREQDGNGQYRDHFGVTKREYFAAMALQGLLAHPESDNHGDTEIASQSVNLADALLAELGKEES